MEKLVKEVIYAGINTFISHVSREDALSVRKAFEEGKPNSIVTITGSPEFNIRVSDIYAITFDELTEDEEEA